MPRAGTFLEATISFFNTVALNAVGNMRSTQEDLRSGNFKLEKAIGGALSIWLDASEGLLSALLVTVNGPVPTIFLRLQPSTSTVTQSAKLRVPGDGALDFSGLAQIGGIGRIDGSLVMITRSSSGDGIEVKLKGLNGGRPGPGFYQGLVYIGDLPLAIVMVQVDP